MNVLLVQRNNFFFRFSGLGGRRSLSAAETAGFDPVYQTDELNHNQGRHGYHGHNAECVREHVPAQGFAGAHGGTVIKAREIDGDEQKKIFGMIVQPEKEIVLMLVRLEQKKEIVKAICAAVLEKTGEHALVYSLAVGDTVGLK